MVTGGRAGEAFDFAVRPWPAGPVVNVLVAAAVVERFAVQGAVTAGDGASAVAGCAGIRQSRAASAQALEAAGSQPAERWGGTGGTALSWPEGDRALAH